MSAVARQKRSASPPLPSHVGVEFAVLDRELPRGDHWVFEIKYDGFRTIAYLEQGSVHLESRNALSFDDRFPGVRKSVASLRVQNAILDGEVCALDSTGKSSFENLAGGSQHLVYFVFDLLWLNGEDLRPLPLLERQTRLAKLVPGTSKGVIRRAPSVSDGESLLEAAREMGLEGILAKDSRAPYRGMRSGAFRKIKLDTHQDLAIVGYTLPRGSRTAIGALLLGYWNETKSEYVYAGKVGTGFTQATLIELAALLEKHIVPRPVVSGAPRMRDAVWVKPTLVAEIRFGQWTRDGRLRHPAFMGLRPDKQPSDTRQEL